MRKERITISGFVVKGDFEFLRLRIFYHLFNILVWILPIKGTAEITYDHFTLDSVTLHMRRRMEKALFPDARYYIGINSNKS